MTADQTDAVEVHRASAIRVPVTLDEARAALALTEAKVAALEATAEAASHRSGRVWQALAHWREKRAEAAYWIARIEAGDTLDPTGEIEPLRAEVARLEAEVRIADAKRAEAERKVRPVRPEHVENIERQLAGLARNNRALRDELAAIKGMLGVGENVAPRPSPGAVLRLSSEIGTGAVRVTCEKSRAKVNGE